jgi:hypothetical protein
LGYDKAKLKGMEFNDIQKDLEKRFSGSALENANTFEGVMARFRITMDELKETLGQAILPYMKKLAEYGIQIADAFGERGVRGAFEELKYVLANLLYDENGQLNAAGQAIQTVVDKLNGLVNIINGILGIPFIALPNQALGAIGAPSIPYLPEVGGLAPSINPGALRGIRGQGTGVNVTVQTGIGDPVLIGRQVVNAINAYERRNGGR